MSGGGRTRSPATSIPRSRGTTATSSSPTTGRSWTYCIYEAPSIDIVEGHASALGMHTVDGIYEIAGDVTPDDFPLT